MEDVTYLWVAEQVLRKHGRPLNARALVNYGLEDGLFPATGLSHTPQKSMQARLSMDILNNENSTFVRTARGKFLLRDQLDSGAKGDDVELKIYTAERHVPSPSGEMVLCVPKAKYKNFLGYQGVGFIGENNPLETLGESEFVYRQRAEAELDGDMKQVITYTIIQHQSKILSFRRGLYNRAANFLRGAQCVGFGGHVNEDDQDLFSLSDHGIRRNAAREIAEELSLSSGPPQIDPEALEFLGVLNDDSSDIGVRHMAVVLRYWVDDWSEWRNVGKGEASINRLRWVDTKADAINLSDFEYWSQLVVRSFFPASMKMVPGYKIIRRSAFNQRHALCVVGSIGSGKSVTSNVFAERAGYASVNSGRVLAELMGVEPIPATPRGKFQAMAESFIARKQGPSELGAALANAVENVGVDRVLVDGIRHPPTLEALRSNLQIPTALLYVYTPPDVAYHMYKERDGHGEQGTDFEEFVTLYTAPVESKIRYMIGDADVITFNWLGFDGYSKVLDELMGELYAH